MTYRIAWLSPMTPTSGVGTFSHAILSKFPTSFDGEPVDVTVFYVSHRALYQNKHRSIQIGQGEDFHQILTLFDLLVYNVGNNREHHEDIFSLLRLYPGIVICHDYVYQHYFADRSLRSGNSFTSFAALLSKFGGGPAVEYLQRSRITSRRGRVRYSPWDSEVSVVQPMSDAILALGSALVVHSAFAQQHVERNFEGPVLRLGMPHDQKLHNEMVDPAAWERSLAGKPFFTLVSFGHIQTTKCIDLVLSAIASSPTLRRRIRYKIAGFAGDPNYFDRLKSIVAAQMLQDIVSFELDVSERRLGEIVYEADLFSNLRRPNTEGSSVSLIEQLDAGKPVVILDSGCYAEVPANAAIKLPPDATSDDIRIALERLIGKPEAMPVIGRAGRAFARCWTCESYGDQFVRFVFEHRILLDQRARAVAVRRLPAPKVSANDKWTENLAQARASLVYFDLNFLLVDPQLIMRKTLDELCDYTSHVILGVFRDIRLQRALACFFARLDGQSAYWACVRFALIADAVFADDASARDRLMSLKPCYDPEFWAVIQTFPSQQYVATATLILMRRPPSPDALIGNGSDDQNGFPKRLHLRELVRSLEPARGSELERLGLWLDEPCLPAADQDLAMVADSFETQLGSSEFKEKVELSGFYGLETDHAWTRGHRGFFGIRLPAGNARVAVLVNHLDGSVARPCAISLACDGRVSTIEVQDCGPVWIALELPEPACPSNKLRWLTLSTDVACSPPSEDRRVLGINVHRMRVDLLERSIPRAEVFEVVQLHKAQGTRRGLRVASASPAAHDNREPHDKIFELRRAEAE